MKQDLLASLSAVLTVMGTILSWTNLRFPGLIPAGAKLMILFLLVMLWLFQLMVMALAKPGIAYKCGMFIAGAASAFYWLCAVESFRIYRVYHRSAGDWSMLAVTMVAALGITAVCLLSPAVSSRENREDTHETDRA